MIIIMGAVQDQPPVDLMPIIAICISSLSAACAIAGVVFTALSSARAKRAEDLAGNAEKRAIRAEERSVAAEKQAEERRQFALWADAITAMQEMVSFHARSPEIQTKLMNLRIAFTELTDGLGHTLYPKLDEYLAGIHGATSLMYERSIAQINNYELDGRRATVDEIFGSHTPIVDWLSANIGNFRLLRTTGSGLKANEWIKGGTENAAEIYERLTKEKSNAWASQEGS